jgi:hypothetical protein
VVRVETRRLGPAEERLLVEEAGAGLSRGETGCLLAGGLLGMPALGWLIADNLAGWLRLAHGPSVRAGGALGLAAGALWAAWPFLLVGNAGRRLLRDERRLRLAAGPVERWTFEPARAWNVECRQIRALLFELSDGRLVLLASRYLEGLSRDHYPTHVEMEVLPQLDRLLSFEASGEPRPTEEARFTLEELGNDYPLKSRRFAELAPDGLEDATRSRLGLPARAPAAAAREAVASRLPLDRVIRAGDAVDRLDRLATPPARLAAALLTWGAPVCAVLAVMAARAGGLRLPRGGAAASVLLVAFALWVMVAAPLGEWVRRRSALRALRRGRGPLVHVSGRARARQTFPAPLTGRRAVAARVDLLLGPHGLMQGVDFEVVTPDGAALRVDAREARLLREGGDRQIVQVETRDALRLLGSVEADWSRKRRFQYPSEDVVQDGDVVHVFGRRDGTGMILGAPDRPLLVWTEGKPHAVLWRLFG